MRVMNRERRKRKRLSSVEWNGSWVECTVLGRMHRGGGKATTPFGAQQLTSLTADNAYGRKEWSAGAREKLRAEESAAY